jgi:hypothetical protein
MRSAPPPPSRAEVERQFIELLAGRVSRDTVNRWAAHWVAADDPAVEDPSIWWALGILYGIDLQHGPSEPYLHDDEQIASWVEELRARSGTPNDIRSLGEGVPAGGLIGHGYWCR